jgi:hypothetical protein
MEPPPANPQPPPEKPMTIWYILAFLVGVTGIIGTRYWQVHRPIPQPQIKPVTIPVSPSPAAYSYRPPSTAIVGTVTAATDKVTKTFWDNDSPGVATPGAQLFQGETLVTGSAATASADIDSIVRIDLDSASEVDFTSLIPDRLLVTQPAGLVGYVASESAVLSVRSLGMLLKIQGGTVNVDREDNFIYLNQISGQSTFALVDNDNNTQVYTLNENQRATINDTYSTVRIR